ncbi:MAG: E3 binding domain-containing protein, partial [Paracoccaceae bacterium]|nr:E3 binding domain-containing protein [Paracoccaceae bacterium]
MSTEVRVPTLGESVTEATVATWFKKPGDAVAVDEMLCELETDKVTVEVPSPVAGTLSEIVAAEGETVGVDALLAQIAEGDAAPAPKAETPKEEPKAEAEAPAPQTKGRDVEDAPSAKKLMAENNLSDLQGTGKDGRVMKEDVLNALAAPAPA